MGTSPYCEISDCDFDQQNGNAIASGSTFATIKADRLNVTYAAECTFKFSWPINGYIRNSLLAKGSDYVVIASSYSSDFPDITHFDMTDNWWGTDDPEIIQTWINDAITDPEKSTIIDWEPFKSESLPTEEKSLGDLKLCSGNYWNLRK